VISPIVNLFPTPVWKVRINNCAEINKALIDNFDLMMKNDNRDSKKKWNSKRNLQHSLFMKPLNKEVTRIASGVLDSIGISHSGYTITGAWANVHPPNQPHHPHSHPNNYLAGVYYVKVPEGANTISFLDPRPTVGLIRPPVKKQTVYNSEKVDLIIADGDLCFFPCWLRHSVNTNTGNEDRISVAFNIMFEDYVNKMSKPMW
jgi:uncharacterized protein (TIGR02466 family)